MDVFALLFILSFIALLVTLVVISVRKSIKLKNLNISKRRRSYGLSKEKAERISLNTQKAYMCSYGLESSMMKQEVNETQEKYLETLPHHKTRVKNRSKRQRKK